MRYRSGGDRQFVAFMRANKSSYSDACNIGHDWRSHAEAHIHDLIVQNRISVIWMVISLGVR